MPPSGALGTLVMAVTWDCVRGAWLVSHGWIAQIEVLLAGHVRAP
jgi:hypothetical protein